MDISIIMMVHMEKNKRSKHGGSVVGRDVIRKRELVAHNRLMLDYFSPNLVHQKRYFRCRF